MRYWYNSNDIFVHPDDLIAFAWSAPMRDLAAQLELSDVGLKKLLSSHGIVSPPQRYWNKVRAGKNVLKRPKATARRPGETGLIRIDHRFAKLVPHAQPLSSAGPFVSANVPEDLDELRAIETEAIGRVSVPKSLGLCHRGLADVIKMEARRREKVATSGWHWDRPKFDTPLAKRRLRILNAVFLSLAKRGHDGDAQERDGIIEARVGVGDMSMGLTIETNGNQRTVKHYGCDRSALDLPALSTPVGFQASGAA